MADLVTQKQIADRVGMSRSMVALALSGHPRISAKTRAKIEEAAAAMGYHAGSNTEARALINRRFGKRMRTGVVAILMPGSLFAGVPLTGVPFFIPVLQGIENECLKRGLDVLLCSLHDGKLPRLVHQSHIDGVICVGAIIYDLSSVAIPRVVFGGVAQWAKGILPADYLGSRLAVRHLLDRGHRRVAYIGQTGTRGYSNVLLRRRGFAEELKQAGLAADPDLMECHGFQPTIQHGYEAMGALLERGVPFTALACYNDLIAMGAIKKARELGLRVPEDLAVAGFDDVSQSYDFDPAITSVAFDREAMGRRAVDWICGALDQLDETGIVPDDKPEVFDVSLQVRQSS